MINVINFDYVTKKHIKNKRFGGDRAASNDALYIKNNDEIYFIEFKNGKIDTEAKLEIKLKICESLLIFMDIINKDLSFTRESVKYILVYNQEKNASESKDYLYKHKIEEKAKEKSIQASLRRFEKLYFKEVFTVTKEEFETVFIKKWCEQ